MYQITLTDHAYKQYKGRGGKDNFKRLKVKLHNRFNHQIHSDEGIRPNPKEEPFTFWIDLGGGFYAVTTISFYRWVCCTIILNSDERHA